MLFDDRCPSGRVEISLPVALWRLEAHFCTTSLCQMIAPNRICRRKIGRVKPIGSRPPREVSPTLETLAAHLNLRPGFSWPPSSH